MAPGEPSSETPDERAAPTVPFARFVRYFLGLGTWGFGGPIATVGYMQRDLVERRRWLTREDFLDGVALGQTMPGPLAAHKLARMTNRWDWRLWAISAVLDAATALTGAEIAVLFIPAGPIIIAVD